MIAFLINFNFSKYGEIINYIKIVKLKQCFIVYYHTILNIEILFISTVT